MTLASKFCDISEDDIKIIKACRKTALFHGNEVWIKKNNFDVAQGSYDGAEISELIGIYVLHKIKESFGDMLIGLYRDDCLLVIDGTNSDIERKRKLIVKIFANCNLKLEDASPIQT